MRNTGVIINGVTAQLCWTFLRYKLPDASRLAVLMSLGTVILLVEFFIYFIFDIMCNGGAKREQGIGG
jgi:hypothetical protein